MDEAEVTHKWDMMRTLELTILAQITIRKEVVVELTVEIKTKVAESRREVAEIQIEVVETLIEAGVITEDEAILIEAAVITEAVAIKIVVVTIIEEAEEITIVVVTIKEAVLKEVGTIKETRMIAEIDINLEDLTLEEAEEPITNEVTNE